MFWTNKRVAAFLETKYVFFLLFELKHSYLYCFFLCFFPFCVFLMMLNWFSKTQITKKSFEKNKNVIFSSPESVKTSCPEDKTTS